MHRLIHLALGLSVLCVGCASAPTREPVRPEPDFVRSSVECNELGPADLPDPVKLDPFPYGWALARVDVERGAVVKVEILDASPRHIVEAPTIALIQREHYPSLKSAHGCVWSYKWG